MRFVIGGANGGKRDFVRENYGIDEILIADYDSVLTAKAVYGFHIFKNKLIIEQIEYYILHTNFSFFYLVHCCIFDNSF